MKRFINNKGAAFIPFLLAVGIIFGASTLAIKQNWKKAQPEVKWHHYKMVKDPAPAPFGYEVYHEDDILLDIPVPMPEDE